jgi:hypothetical protein
MSSTFKSRKMFSIQCIKRSRGDAKAGGKYLDDVACDPPALLCPLYSLPAATISRKSKYFEVNEFLSLHNEQHQVKKQWKMVLVPSCCL